MSATPQRDALALGAAWRRVLDLGGQLMDLARQAMQTTPNAQVPVTAQRDAIEAAAASLLHGRATLWLDAEVLRLYAGKTPIDLLPGAQPAEPNSPLMRRAKETGEVCCAEESSREAQGAPSQGDGCQGVTCIAVPIFVRQGASQQNAVLGVLQVERPEEMPFDEPEVELLRGVAAQSGLAVQAGLQLAQEHWRLEQLALVQQVSAQLAEVRDLDELFARVTDLVLRAFHYYYVAIFTLEPGQNILRFRSSAGPLRLEGGAGETSYSPSLAVHVGQGIIGYVAQTGEEVWAEDVRQEVRYRHLDALPQTRSEVALPLRVENRILGVLDVQSDQVDDFDETDVLVLRALAGNISIAIEGARLYATLRQRAIQLSTIQEVSNAITSILNQEELLNEVVELIHMRFGYPFVHLYTVHPGRRKIFYEAGSGARSQALVRQAFAYDLDDPAGLIPWVAREGEMLLVNDVSQEPRYRPAPVLPERTQSELAVPLIFGGEVLGVLDIQSDQLNAFGEEDRFLFATLADNIAIAMRNASLYRSETWRRRVADSLREVAGLLSADVDLDQVLKAILAELERTLPLELAAIWLLDEAVSTVETESALALRLAAIHGADAPDMEWGVGLTLQEVLECSLQETAHSVPAESVTWLLEALSSEQPVARNPGAPAEPLGAALEYPGDYSAVAAPLRVGEQRLGLLILAHRTSDRYGGEARLITAAFASYAAVAIQNTRLYESAHEQAWVSTVLLQVADATQSLTNLNELLDTVIRITPTLAGVKACLLYLVDENGVFVPAVASGLNPEQQAEFERWRFAPGDVPALDRLLEEQRLIVLHRDAEDMRLASILIAGEQDRSALETELLVLVPLLAHEEVLGAFLVDYSAPHYGLSEDALEEFFEERLAIIQGIAHQTGIAVENLNLIRAQKEEAYVSVALLQVAQAVVSSNELDEALGSIVRITPILVGVQRALIYLWDKQKAVFYLSQAYGVPRRAQERIFAAGEFPLLDAVCQRNSLLACPAGMGEPPSGDITEVWSSLAAPDEAQVDEYLENAPCLLLAFPLSVRGEVLGVFLVEEPETVPMEGFGGRRSNPRLREKRLEIITGISQQAALAIQNELLQRERVERERLEREMQLARDIQRTFLPQSVPELPGWELEVLWRTAREVGGDFYDFFELPEKRLGLLIADVADKGMPAALFMVLVRTLMRAAARETRSPAEVLQRVNDILEPDAAGGMFVTLAYAVLDLESGELEYANAGHNPPLFLHSQTCHLERLEKGGMALGVLEGNRVEGRKVNMAPGDFLVMYTDGVTEAFSPQGEIYGEERLQRVVVDFAQCAAEEGRLGFLTARDMLEAIDAAVTAFIAASTPSDDLTLLVLRRLAG